MKTLFHPVVTASRTAWKDSQAWWKSISRAEQATTVLFACMIIGGVLLRMQGIGFPPRLTFDEQFYGPTSHNFLIGVPDLHDYHPPFGKLLGSIGLLLYGYNSVGWRFAYLCFGLQTMVVAFFLAREIFADRRAGWVAAAFMAADGFFIAYSRAGLIDGMLTCFVLWSMLAIVTARTWRGVFVTAILIGATTSIKWSGALTLIPATIALLVLGRVRWYQLFWFAVTPVVHLLIWSFGLRLMGHANDPVSLWKVLHHSFVSLAATGAYDNPLMSAWYTWPFLYHPIVVKLSSFGGTSHYASSAGNPVFWFPVTALVLGLPLLKAAGLVKKSWQRFWPASLDPAFTRAALLLPLGWFALISMWSVTLGKHMFFYHYQPSYGFGLVLLAGTVARLERRRPGAVLAFVILAVVAAVYMAPVWGEFALTETEANRRLMFLPWRP
ncbi:MAG TPA: phospholipid carrier-dependent glycosyltransferase [Polyangia bacterium]